MSFFVVPVATGTVAGRQLLVPAYVPALGVTWAMVDIADSAVVWADATPAQEAVIGANTDATVMPPLDNTVAVNATKNALETMNIPAQWVVAGMTYRQVLRVVCGMAMLVQGTRALGRPVTLSGNLSLAINQLPLELQQSLAASSDMLGLDRSQITGATTVRVALKILGQQFLDGRGISLGDL